MKILVVAPHADDEIIGVGGTIAKRIAEGAEVYVCIVTKGVSPIFTEKYMQTLRNETFECHKKAGIKNTYFLEFPSVTLEKESRYKINDAIYEVIREVLPDDIYIPHNGDMQRDHRIVAESTMVAARPKYDHKIKNIYAYETLSETGWNIPNIQNEFIPNVYVNISDYMEQKIKYMNCYKSQLNDFPNARSIEAIEALARFRGALMNVCAAEAFMLIRNLEL